jgi:hypothetical protein
MDETYKNIIIMAQQINNNYNNIMNSNVKEFIRTSKHQIDRFKTNFEDNTYNDQELNSLYIAFTIYLCYIN